MDIFQNLLLTNPMRTYTGDATGLLEAANNLSDVADANTAIGNLSADLQTIAEQDNEAFGLARLEDDSAQTARYALGVSRIDAPLGATFSPLAYGSSAVLTILGDSTGNETFEWPYRIVTEKIAVAYPDACIRYCVWDDAAQKYGVWSTLQAGASGQRYFIPVAWRMMLATDVKTRSSADFELEIDFSLPDWTPSSAARVVGQLGNAGNRAWYLQVNTNGTISFIWSADATNLITVTSSNPGFTDGTRYRLRVQFDANNGSGNYNVKIAWSSDDGANWTTIADSTGVGTSSIATSTADYQVGAVSGSGYCSPSVYEITARDGIGGPHIFPASLEAWGCNDVTNSLANSFSGSPTLYVFNGSHPGANIVYLNDATRGPKMAVFAPNQLVILNTGHNDVAYRGSSRFTTAWTDFISALRSRMPTAAIFACNQNPRNIAEDAGKTFNDEYTIQARSLPALLQRLSVGCIDTYSAYQRVILGGVSPATLFPDGIHPASGAGVDPWVDAVDKAIMRATGESP